MNPEPTPGPQQTVDVLGDAFEAAIRGDAAALSVLLSLLKTRYGQLIFKRLRSHRRGAHTATLDDIFQQSMVDFIERINTGSLAELPEEERRDVVRYFQDLCDRKLENAKKPRTDPVNSRKMGAVPFDLIQDQRVRQKVSIPGTGHDREHHLQLMNQSIAKLDPFDRLVIERYLAEVPYSEISRETGMKVSTLESLVTRIKQELAEAIAQESKTAMLEIQRKKDPARKKSFLPKPADILAAIDDLPIEAQHAVEFVHVKGGSIEALAASLGDQGLVLAQAQLESGYESLSVALGVPFPDSFHLLKK